MKTSYPDSLTIQQYLEGKLDPEMAHQLEKQALDDPFLWDALEGYSTYRDAAADLSILQRQLHERIVHSQENKKVFDLTWQRLSVAAAAAVMFVSAGILFWMSSHQPAEQLASSKPVEVSVIDRDSVHTVIHGKDQQIVAATKPTNLNSKQESVASYNSSSVKKESLVLANDEINTIVKEESVALDRADIQAAAMSARVASRTAKAGKISSEDMAASEVKMNANIVRPKAGWDSYRSYLLENTKKFKPQQVLTGSSLVSVQIGADGKVDKVAVVRSLNKIYDDEAIRIIKSGPEWLASPEGTPAEILVEVSF